MAKNNQADQQNFEIREHRVGPDPMVDLLPWMGRGNKVSIPVHTESLPRLRDALTDYIEKNEIS